MNKKIWLHRISHHGNISRPLLRNHQYLSIGFSDFLDCENFIENTIDNGQKYIDKIVKDVWGSKKRTRKNILNFIKIKKGDWVLVPSTGIFSVYEVVDEKAIPIYEIKEILIKEFESNKLIIKDQRIYDLSNPSTERKIDLGFVRKVKPLNTEVSRKFYADSALTSMLKVRFTTVDISKLKENINNALESCVLKQPINLRSQIEDSVADNILSLIVKNLNPDKWEKLIKQYFMKCGASTVEIPSKNKKDKKGDVDIIATFEQIKTIIYVQAKFHKERTSIRAINQVEEYVSNLDELEKDEEYSKLKWVISSADSFTDECKDIIIEKEIKLINGKEFVLMLLNVGLSNLDEI